MRDGGRTTLDDKRLTLSHEDHVRCTTSKNDGIGFVRGVFGYGRKTVKVLHERGKGQKSWLRDLLGVIFGSSLSDVWTLNERLTRGTIHTALGRRRSACSRCMCQTTTTRSQLYCRELRLVSDICGRKEKSIFPVSHHLS